VLDVVLSLHSSNY